MYLKRQYVGICSKCGHDVFLEIYAQKIDLIQSCECLDNRIIRQSWWETYVLKPAVYKIALSIACVYAFGWQITHVMTLFCLSVFLGWLSERTRRIQYKVATKNIVDKRGFNEETFISSV